MNKFKKSELNPYKSLNLKKGTFFLLALEMGALNPKKSKTELNLFSKKWTSVGWHPLSDPCPTFEFLLIVPLILISIPVLL